MGEESCLALKLSHRLRTICHTLDAILDVTKGIAITEGLFAQM